MHDGATGRPMVIRTVFDGRPHAGRKYALQVALLAASWSASVKAPMDTPLEIVAVGEMPRALADLLARLGARVIPAAPHEHEGICRYANKLLGATLDPGGPVLLLDNDTCIIGEIGGFGGVAGIGVMAAVAERERVSPAQWRLIETHLRLSPLDREWVPLVEIARHAHGGMAARSRRGLYVNGGVLWLDQPAEFGALWASHIHRIAAVFENHPLCDRHVRGSDQAALATAIGTYGRFGSLDDTYNYRPPSFWIGKHAAADIRIVHMAGMDISGLGPSCTVETAVRGFWTDRITSRLERLVPSIGARGYRYPSACWRGCAASSMPFSSITWPSED